MKYIYHFVSIPVLSVLFLLLPSNDSAAAKVITVSAESGENIQSAIDGADAGDSIIVKEGRYQENLNISKSIKIIAESGATKTFIDAAQKEKPVLHVFDTSDIEIKGFSIAGSLKSGIMVSRSKGITLLSNFMTDNNIGIYLRDSSKSLIKENEAENNSTGIYLHSSHDNILEENKAHSNRDKGILLISSDRNSLVSNRADSNYWNGITLASSNGNLISNNSAVSNTYAIVIADSIGNMEEGNLTMRRLKFILPVALLYLSIMVYFAERRIFIIYCKRRSA